MPVKKLKISGIVNSGNSNYFVIEKHRKFLKGMRNLLRGIGFNELWWNSLGRPINSHGEYNLNKETPIRRFKDGFKYMIKTEDC